jgi:hypothetical protein
MTGFTPPTTMRSATGKILALTVMFSLLLSSFGIARVTHFCKMAAHSVEVTSCKTGERHDCCTDQNKNTAKSCCTTIVKMFRADLQSLFKTPVRLAHEMVTMVMLRHESFTPTLISLIAVTAQPDPEGESPSGRERTIQICSFLI